MSASLVGSEMCIRDSETAGRAGLPAAHIGLPGPPAVVALARPPVRRGACLLYTSDAADDM
eukprot:7290627-Alexandrium_andersonii.AAC.1